jgi:hypothetical protein
MSEIKKQSSESFKEKQKKSDHKPKVQNTCLHMRMQHMFSIVSKFQRLYLLFLSEKAENLKKIGGTKPN